MHVEHTIEGVPTSEHPKETRHMKPIPYPYRDSGCFFCGNNNPGGLRLQFHETESEPKELVCRWIPADMYKGFGKILHGGIQSGLFDEIMGWTALHLTGKVGVTSSLEIQFHKPVYVEQEIEVRCRIHSIDGPRIRLAAEITTSDNAVRSSATGVYVLMERDRFAGLVGEG